MLTDRLPSARLGRGFLLATALTAAAAVSSGCAPETGAEDDLNHDGVTTPSEAEANAAMHEMRDGPGGKPNEQPGSAPYKLPFEIRSRLPEAVAQATETAENLRRRVPEKGEPTKESIQIVRELFSHCKPDPRNDPKGEDMWGGWIVKLNSATHYLERGKASVELKTPSGLLISRDSLLDIGLSPGSIGYIPAFLEPLAKHRALFGTGPGYFLPTKGSQLGSARLDLTGPLAWKRVDGSPREYRWEAKYAGLETVTPASPHYNRIYEYGPRILSVQFSNNGERAIKGVGLFGFLINGGGLIDILQGEASSVNYGETKVIQAKSVSNTGRCAGTGDAGRDSELLWWTTFNTHTGMPVEKYESLRLPTG